LLNHHVSAVEARLLCGLVGQSKFAMSSSEVDLELSPCFGRYRSRLPCTTGVRKKYCIKYESVCNVNNHSSTVRLAACNRESSCVLNLLKKRLDRLIRIIRRVESLVVLRDRQKNKAAQILCTDFGFVRAFPMKKESKARESLSLLFHRYRVPNVMVMDGSKAQTEGQFIRKLCDKGCHIKQTELHTQSSNMGEGGMRELKIGVGRQLLCSDCPKRLWDDCIIR
jgi:hypothetical protein